MKDRKSIRNKEKGASRSFAMPFDASFFCYFLKRIVEITVRAGFSSSSSSFF